MAQQPLFHDDDQELFNPYFRHRTFNGFSNSMLSVANSEIKTMTLDRRTAKTAEKVETNIYATLPRHAASNFAKLKTIGAFTNMFLTNREAIIVEEELNYLKSVESGDLERVEEILDENDNSESDSSEDDEEEEEEEEKEKPQVKNSSVKLKTKTSQNSEKDVEKMNRVDSPSPHRTRSFVYDVEAFNSNHQGTALEMVEVNEARQRRTSTARKGLPSPALWKKAAKASNAPSPLPVALAKKRGPHLGSKETLDVPASEATPRKRKVKFNKNCRDQWGRSALFIAMLHHNLDMMNLLLRHKVDMDECLYHAIDFGYYDVVEVLMNYDEDANQVIKGENSFYPPGLTPMQLAAHKNDYVMLKILYSHGYRIPDQQQIKKRISFKTKSADSSELNGTVLDRAWDSSNQQILYYRAIASPAYMVLMFNEGTENETEKWDFLENIFNLYGRLRKKVSNEPAVRSLYLPLADQVEEFACDLLGEVRSSSDLANLLRFDPPGQRRMISQRNYLTPVQHAIEVRMKRFVAHQNSQIAISSLRMGTLFDYERGFRTFFIRLICAIGFPILCLGFVFSLDSTFGRLLCNPIINMSCHITSEVIFLALMILRLIFYTVVFDCDCLGMAVNPLDWIIFTWVIARMVNQVKKIRETSFLEMFSNIWSLNDMAVSALFFIVIVFKAYDLIAYPHRYYTYSCPYTEGFNGSLNNLSDADKHILQCYRDQWTLEQVWPITISESAWAVIYILIHVRAMELLYTDRTFGPLQLSLDRMLVDTIRFLTIFTVTFLAFAFAMTQLYWAWGRPRQLQLKNEGKSIGMCNQNTNENQLCYPVYANILDALLEQYWTLYGYGWGNEPPSATNIPREKNENINNGATELSGQIVSMLFHAWAVVVMLNMLVAMMSHSFDRVRSNAELEWKFHRSSMWMKFIRKGIYPRPPPMNLIPSSRDIKSFLNWVKRKTASCRRMAPSRHNANREDIPTSVVFENKNYKQAVTNITNRYLHRYLLPDFRHDEIDQPDTRFGQRRNSTILDEATA